MMILLLSSIIISVLNAYLPDLVEKTVKRLLKFGPPSTLQEMESLSRQMKEINMKDDFAKYARLQRQLNKLKDEYKEKAQERASQKWKYGMISRYGTQFVMTVTSMTMFWKYRSTPVAILNEDWLEPVSSVLSWPTYIPGALSFPVWYLMCSTVVKMTLDPQSLRLQ